MKLLRSLARRSVRELTRAAALLALAALGIMAYSVVSPRPLPVILAMSAGHALGALAIAFYLLAVVLHSRGVPDAPEAAARGDGERAAPARGAGGAP